MTAVFITGIAGFLGSHLAEYFIARGFRVSGCDNLVGGDIANIPAGAFFHNRVDCLNLDAMTRIMSGVDVVYHCAAHAHEGLSVFSPHIVTQNVFGATTATLSAAISNKVKRFIYLSSMARYGTQATVPFTEDMLPMPQDPYGIAKVASELMVRNLCAVHGMDFVIAVPHNIIGPRQKYDDPYRNVAAIMINLMLQGRQPIIYGDGEQKRCFSFVGDVVKPLARMIDAGNGNVINIGPDADFITINELAETIAGMIGVELEPVYVPGRPQEVTLATCSAAKARKLLAYRPRTKWTDGLMTMIKHIRGRGPKPFAYHLPLEIVSDLTPKTWTERLF